MTGLLFTLAYTLACLGVGAATLRAIGRRSWARWQQSGLPIVSSAFVVGQGVTAALWVPVGLLGKLSAAMIVPVVALGALVGLAFVAPRARGALARAAAGFAAIRSRSLAMAILALALAVLVTAFGVTAWFSPPIGDAEAFYVTYARVMAASQRLEPMPGIYETFSSIGLVGELHLAALIAVAGVPAAKLFVWTIGLAGAAILDSICKASGIGLLGRLIALALLYTSTAFTYHLFDGKVDVFAASLGLLAARWCLAIGPAATRAATLAIVGLCTGFAVIAKFSFAVGVVPAIVALIFWNDSPPSKGTLGHRARSFAVFAACALAAAAPHMLKNAVLFDAPLAPFITSSAQQDWLQQVWFSPEVTRRIVLTYPLALVFGRYPMQSGNVSYLLLAFAPLVCWLPRDGTFRQSASRQFCAAAFVGLLCWVALRPSIIAPRYILASLILFYPIVAKAAEHAYEAERGTAWLRAAMVAFLASALVVFAAPVRKPLRYALSAGNDTCALASHYCAPLTLVSQRAAPGDRVFFAGYYSYWLRDDLLLCRDRGKESAMLRPGQVHALTWQLLLERGFSWVVVDGSSHEHVWQQLSRSAVPENVRLETLWDRNGVRVVRIDVRSVRAGGACRQTGDRAWEPA